jgi:hypothetical protein
LGHLVVHLTKQFSDKIYGGHGVAPSLMFVHHQLETTPSPFQLFLKLAPTVNRHWHDQPRLFHRCWLG